MTACGGALLWASCTDTGVHDAAAPAAATAGLRVEVEPAQGLCIWLDAVPVATQSPYLSVELSPGAHALEVAAMGHHPLTLPLVLRAGEVLHVPVSLRPRLAQPPDSPTPALSLRRLPWTPKPLVTADAGTTAPRPSPPPLPDPAAATELAADVAADSLAAGAESLLLQFAAEPAVAVRLDDVRVGRHELYSRRQHGILEAGTLRIGYTVSRSRTMEFMVPQDGAAWFADGSEVKAGTLLRLGLGTLRLLRTDAQGSRQSLLVTRIL